MKKKILALCLVVVLAVTAVTGVTLAYFTDSDADVNVMTAGNVKIIQDEWQITEAEGIGYEPFENGKPLFPYTGKTYENGVASEYTADLIYPYGEDGDDDNHYGDTARNVGKYSFSAKDNAISKIITVTNTGTMPAYIRTLFAFELGKDGTNPAAEGVGMLNFGMAGYSTNFKWTDVVIEINGVKFAVGEYYYSTKYTDAAGVEYTGALAPKTTSHSSLNHLYLSPLVGNEWYDNFGQYYNIIAVSQAAQIAGFDDAKDALNTAFGKVEAANKEEVAKWFAPQEGVVFVETAHDTYDYLSDADKAIFAENGTNITPVSEPTEAPAEEG